MLNETERLDLEIGSQNLVNLKIGEKSKTSFPVEDKISKDKLDKFIFSFYSIKHGIRFDRESGHVYL